MTIKRKDPSEYGYNPEVLQKLAKEVLGNEDVEPLAIFYWGIRHHEDGAYSQEMCISCGEPSRTIQELSQEQIAEMVQSIGLTSDEIAKAIVEAMYHALGVSPGGFPPKEGSN